MTLVKVIILPIIRYLAPIQCKQLGGERGKYLIEAGEDFFLAHERETVNNRRGNGRIGQGDSEGHKEGTGGPAFILDKAKKGFLKGRDLPNLDPGKNIAGAFKKYGGVGGGNITGSKQFDINLGFFVDNG